MQENELVLTSHSAQNVTNNQFTPEFQPPLNPSTVHPRHVIREQMPCTHAPLPSLAE